MLTDSNKRPDIVSSSKGADFQLPDDEAKKELETRGAESLNHLSVPELESILEKKRAAEKGLPDSGGSRIGTKVNEEKIIDAIGNQTVDPKILSTDKNPADINYGKKLEEFMDNPYNTVEDLMKQKPN